VVDVIFENEFAASSTPLTVFAAKLMVER